VCLLVLFVLCSICVILCVFAICIDMCVACSTVSSEPAVPSIEQATKKHLKYVPKNAKCVLVCAHAVVLCIACV
jgi:hypothetical protein